MQPWLDLLKTLLGIPLDDTSKDPLILMLAGIALRGIQQRTGRTFVHGTFVDRVRGPKLVVWLTEYPVEQIVAIGNDGATIDPAFYRADLRTGRVEFLNGCSCRWGYAPCCTYIPIEITYDANSELPPDYVSLAVADAIRAGMATIDAGNAYGFVAKKVAVTDVGSVEIGGAGDSPAESMSITIDAALDTWTTPTFAGTSVCADQTSELVATIPPARASTRAIV